jgi:enoyl-CoA hydratase
MRLKKSKDVSMPAPTTATTIPKVSLTCDGAIAWLTFDNPARMNALTADMWASIPRLIADADADAAVRVIIVRGAGQKAFCAGADISEFETARTGDAAAGYDALNHAAFEAISGATKPVIAMIHGFCLGGGLGLAAVCDIRLADGASQFAIPAAKLGLGYPPRWVRPLLALAAPAHVKELLFTGRRYKAPDALAMGLVNHVYDAADLERETRALATEIADNAPLTVRASKLAIDELVAKPESPDTQKLNDAVKACFASADYVEGRSAFLEKRKPKFEGQ